MSISYHNQSNVIIDIPQDILLRCVATYLRKRDQYKVFSSCRTLQPLLHQCRSIHIVEESQHDRKKLVTPYSWHWFKTSEEHRQKLLRICGFEGRPLRLTIRFTEAVRGENVLQQYIAHFAEIIMTEESNDEKDSDMDILSMRKRSPFVLLNPTAVSLGRHLQSAWYPGDCARTLQEMWELAQRVSYSLLREIVVTKYCEPASFATLRGVHGLVLQGDGSVFVELSPDSDAKLHRVMLVECGDVEDITSLQGVPEVKLIDCDGIVDVSALSLSTAVSIARCAFIRDVSMLAHLDTVTLRGTGSVDISMLGSVRKLVLQSCEVTDYPVPSVGKGQDWEFHDMDISDVSGLATMEKLKFVDCEALDDISELGHVKYLFVDCCTEIMEASNVPIPLGKEQEWTFRGISMMDFKPGQFAGLHRLRLENCKDVDISMFTGVDQLHLCECFLATNVVSNFAVRELLLVECKIIELFPDKGLSLEDNVQISYLEIVVGELYSLPILHLPVAGTPTLQSLVVKFKPDYHACVDLAKEDLEGANLLLMEKASHTYRLYSSRDLTTAKEDHVSQCAFTNGTLRLAVTLWSIDSAQASRIYGDISSWDVSQVTDMRELFQRRDTFNENINTWDVSNVTNMCFLFDGAEAFNQPLDNWNTGNVTNMGRMFHSASSFNQPLDSWNVGKVTNMMKMFQDASSFNQPLNNWNVGKHVNTKIMFGKSTSFNQPLDNWNVSDLKALFI